MLQVPQAESALKAHPNNKSLCMVMRQPWAQTNPHLSAQQIAFMRVGNKYCSQYYHTRYAWGVEHVAAGKAKFSENKYSSLSYAAYYRQYVIPAMQKIKRQFKTKIDWESICDYPYTSSLSVARRPETDAKIQLWQKYHNNYCAAKPVYQQDYGDTGLSCLTMNRTLCETPKGCDVVERCKVTPGILFSSSDSQKNKLNNTKATSNF